MSIAELSFLFFSDSRLLFKGSLTSSLVCPISMLRAIWSMIYSQRTQFVHSFYHCTETTCNYQKEKGKKKFDHALIFRRDLTYDATTGLWWLLFIKEKGMYYLLCRLHQAKGKHNKSASYGMEPAVRFQISALVEHCSGQNFNQKIPLQQKC